MIFHNLIIDVSTDTCLGKEVVEIPEGDKDSHQLLIKLVQDKQFYHIPEHSTVEISFYDSFDEKVFTTTAAQVVNSHRGYITYVVGSRLVRESGRYVGTLEIFNPLHDKTLSAKFIVNIVKNLSDDHACPRETEVVITREFYDELSGHLRDDSTHLSAAERVLLDFLAESVDMDKTLLTYEGLVKEVKNPGSEIRRFYLDPLVDSATLKWESIEE